VDRSCFSLPSRYFFHFRDVGLPRMMVHPTAGIFRQPHANPPYSILTSHREMRLIPTSTSRKTGPSQRSGFIHHYYPTSVDPRTTEMFHFARFAENSFLPAARIQRFTIFDHVSCPTNPDVSSRSFFADSTHSPLLGRRESNPLMRGSKPRAFPLGYAPLPCASYPRWESNPQPSVFETDAST